MARRRWIWVDGPNGSGLMEVDPSPPPRKRVHIIGDHHEPFQSQADGLYYDSKSVYRRRLKEQGYEEWACSAESRTTAVEQAQARPELPPVKDDLKAAGEMIGFDWSRGPTEAEMSIPPQETSFGWRD